MSPDYYLPILILISYYSLFDMDGTLVDSTTGVKGAWNLFRETYPTIDVNYVLSCEYLYLQYTAFLFLDLFNLDYSVPWRSHCRESQETLWHPRSRDSQSECQLTCAQTLPYGCPSARGGPLWKGYRNHILCRRRSRHYTSSGSQIDYRWSKPQ